MERKTTQLTQRFEEALIYANRIHAEQIREISGAPYISHLLGVSAIVLEDGGDEDEAIAALLHDAIEDIGGIEMGKIIRQKFGDKVADIVETCTESSINPKPPWEERKQTYLDQIRVGSLSAHRVALADKIYNARCHLAEWERYGERAWTKEQIEKIVWFYRSIIVIVREAGDCQFLVNELERVVREISKIVLENSC